MTAFSSFGRRWVQLPGLDAVKTWLVSAGLIREVLTANRTYYVRTDGSDSNTGLANTSGGAFLTVQKAIDTAAALDSSIYDVTIQIVAGTYTTATGLACKRMVGSGKIILVGDETTPANVVLTTNGVMTEATAGVLTVGVSTTYSVRGVKLTSTATGTRYCLLSGSGSSLEFQNVEFGTGWTRHIRAVDYGIIVATGNYTISGGATHHIDSAAGIIRIRFVTVTLTGTPAFTEYCQSTGTGVLFLQSAVYSGSATGIRYDANSNGVINTNAATLPGDAAGSVSTGGQYI